MLELSNTIERKFIDSIDLDDWEIETDTGFQPISQIHKTIEYVEWIIETEDDSKLICADTHIIFDENMNQIFVKDCIPGQTKIVTKNGFSLVTKVEKTTNSSNMFDVTVESKEHRFWSGDILSHNTTCSVAVILHHILFNNYKRVAIIANKASTARDILGRLRLAYEQLPPWIQQGVVIWNKGDIELENGSVVITGATTSSSIRGQSCSCISGDSIIKIKDYEENIQSITIEELKEKLINYVQKNKGFIKNKIGLKVCTSAGWKDFEGIRITPNKKTITIRYENGKSIRCTPDHLINEDGQWIEAKDTNTEKSEGKIESVYDLVNVEDVHSFIANEINVHNCVFLDEFAFVPTNLAEDFFTSTYPTISSGKETKIIIVSTPNGMNHFYEMWLKAEKSESDFKKFEVHWSSVPGRDEKWKEETIRNTSELQFEQEYESCATETLINTSIGQVSIGELYHKLKEQEKI